MAPKMPQAAKEYLTRGQKALADWHKLLRHVAFGCALVLIFASVASIHWACQLIGLRGAWLWEVAAWVVPLAMEFGMAVTAQAWTSIRKDRPGEKPGYYLSLMAVFSVLMALAQVCNIGHAMVSVSGAEAALTDMPTFIPLTAIYVFAGAFAALFPMGGTLLIHVSGFLREHAVDANWVDSEDDVVMVVHGPTAAEVKPKHRTERKAAEKPAEESSPEDEVAKHRTAAHSDEQAKAKARFDGLVAADPLTKPVAADIHSDLGLTTHPATVRRWVQGWWKDHEKARGGQAA